MDLVGIPAQYLDVVWNDVKDRICEVLLKYGDNEYTLNDIHNAIQSRDAQLWTVLDKSAVCVTKLVKRANYKEMVIWYMHADNFNDNHWDLLDQIKSWGKQQGCSKARVYVRPGFEKNMVKHNWVRQYAILTQEL